MKKIISLIITAALVCTSTSVAFAKSNNAGKKNNKPAIHQQKQAKVKKQEFKIKESPVIVYGRYKLPISPVTKGMGATVKFDKETGVLTVTKGSTTIIIDFKNKTVKVNGSEVKDSGIFTQTNNNKMTVLIKYIASLLGVRTEVDEDDVTVEVPTLAAPTSVTVTPVGTVVVANTLNSTSLYLTATANITAGQATGGKAELYVGSKLVATDSAIAATDTTVTFTTSDGTPTNAELQAAVPAGGVVTVKLYNASNNSVISAVTNPTLTVDYVAPAIASVTSAVYNIPGNQLVLNVVGASAAGDKVDVTKLSLYDSTLAKSYQLTNTPQTGSTGVITSENSLSINLGSADKAGLTGFGTTTVYLTVVVGPLLTDAAGNTSNGFTLIQTVPVIVIK